MKYSRLPRLFPRFYQAARLAKKIPPELFHDKLLHFIWLGKKPLSSEFRKNLSYFARSMQRLGGKTLLWIDRKTIDREFRKWLTINNIHPINSDSIFGSSKKMKTFVYYRAAIHSIPPNFGVAGDLLRYEIIHRYGGVYLDCDIRPFEINLKDLIANPEEFLCGFCSKGNFPRNDIFYAPPKSPIMAKYRELVERNFKTKIWNKRLSYSRPFLLDYTILSTGPDVFKEAVESFSDIKFIQSDKDYSAMSWVYDHTKGLKGFHSIPSIHHDLLLNLIHKPTILDLEKYRLAPKAAIMLVKRVLKRHPEFFNQVDRVFLSEPSLYAEIQMRIDTTRTRVWNEHAALKFACIMQANDLIGYLMHHRKTDPRIAAFADVGPYEILKKS